MHIQVVEMLTRSDKCKCFLSAYCSSFALNHNVFYFTTEAFGFMVLGAVSCVAGPPVTVQSGPVARLPV